MTYDEMQNRVEELRPAAEEYRFLEDTLYLIDEGFIEMEGDRLYPIGDPTCL